MDSGPAVSSRGTMKKGVSLMHWVPVLRHHCPERKPYEENLSQNMAAHLLDGFCCRPYPAAPPPRLSRQVVDFVFSYLS